MQQQTSMSFATRTSSNYFFQFWIGAITTIFLAAWLQFKDLTPVEIAIILGANQFVKAFFGPIGALFADGFHYKKTPIFWMNFLSLVAAVLLYIAEGFYPIMGAILFFSIANAAVMPILDGLALQGADYFKFDFGRVRLWGSISFIFASVAMGFLLDLYGYNIFTFLVVFTSLVMLIAGLYLPILPEAAKNEESEGEARGKFDLKGAYGLIKHPIFITILIVASFGMASHGVYYGYSTIHWQSIGYSTNMISFFWALGVGAEIIFLAFSNKVMEYFGPRRLLILGAIGGIIRWTLLAFDPPFAVILFAQILHILTFAANYLGSMHLINRSVPEHLISTAMAINASLNVGIFLSSSMFIGGLLYDSHGALAYLFATLLSTFGLVIALLLKFKWDGSPINFSHLK